MQAEGDARRPPHGLGAAVEIDEETLPDRWKDPRPLTGLLVHVREQADRERWKWENQPSLLAALSLPVIGGDPPE
jgi:hypothetical protein